LKDNNWWYFPWNLCNSSTQQFKVHIITHGFLQKNLHRPGVTNVVPAGTRSPARTM